MADGGKDIRDACALSGEPVIKNLREVMHAELPGSTINAAWALNLERTAYQKKFLEAWNATAKLTKSGKPIDAFIMPMAPFAAVMHDAYDHVTYTSWVRLPKYKAKSRLTGLTILLVLFWLRTRINPSTRKTRITNPSTTQ